MRVLVISNMYPSTQKPFSGLFVVNQVNELKSQVLDSKVDFFYLKRTFTNRIGSILKYLFFLIRFIPYLFGFRKYHIIHVHYYYPTVYLALLYKIFRNRKVKIIVTFHGGDLYNVNTESKFYLLPFTKVDHIIAVSNKLGERIKLYTNKPISVLSAGINPIFKGDLSSAKSFDLIFVGSFYEEKGFDLFCQSLSHVFTPLKICIIGSGELEGELNKIQKFHNVTLLNNLSQVEIIPYLTKSKFLINTSRNESFGLSMTESLASGVPVIATMTDGSAEQIIDNNNGFIILEKTASSIAESINKTLTVNMSDYKKLQNNALESGKKHSLPNVIKELKTIYYSIINQ